MQESLVSLLGHLLVSGVSVFLVAKVMPGMRAKSFGAAVAFAAVMAVLNAVVWHFLGPLTVTLSVLTLGIGAMVLNGVIFLAAGKVTGVAFSGCITAALASLLVTLLNGALEYLLSPR